MAKRPNYNHVKRQKELERQKKQEAKAERKRLRKEDSANGDAETPDDGTLPAAGNEHTATKPGYPT